VIAEQFENYQRDLAEYRRFRACKLYDAALTALKSAIANCPVDEALPTLTLYLEELEPLTRPAPVWKRVLGLAS
jgi:hypothetical protein